MNAKKEQRLRRARRTRAKISKLGIPRLCVHRTPRHIYAQIIAADGARILVSASTVVADIRKAVSYTGNTDAAKVVGRIIAEKAKAIGIEKVAFDRSGFKYHGRVKALAEAAREHGLQF